MKVVHGWHCPDILSGPGNYLNKTGDSEHALQHVKKRRSVVQAGGHIGGWPVMLAPLFERVFTFEPDFENFSCLAANLAQRTAGNVFPVRGVLGNERGPTGLHKSSKSTGQHRVGKGQLVPTFRIDDLGLVDLDAIFLNLEAFEIPALRGALKTIERCRPVIMAEENRRVHEQGFQIGDLGRLLTPLGYRKVAAVNEDLVFHPGPHS